MENKYKQLKVWQKSMDLVEVIYQLTKKLPSNEQYILINQILRSVISIPSNIAEGYGRFHKKEKKQFLTIAYSSSLEVETQLEIIKKVYTNIDVTDLLISVNEIQKMLNSYIVQIEC